MDIQEKLFELKDEEYKAFHAKLIPNVNPESIIGVRVPQLRIFAKTIAKEGMPLEFTAELPHKYYDENMLHAMLINEIKDYDRAIKELDGFLPYVDNWAVCDSIKPKAFEKNHAALAEDIRRWLDSGHLYTERFAVDMLMGHFLDDDFKPEYPETLAKIRSDEYYMNMVLAWYFATALAKQWESIIPYIDENRLDKRVHNKAIQKAIESRRLTSEQKLYLRSKKIK